MALQDFGSLSLTNTPTGAQPKAPATTGQRRGGTTPLDAATIDRIVAEEGATAIRPTVNGIYGQESGGGTNARTSVDGAIGGMQVMPDTFNRFAKPGERIDNPEDNFRVGVRYLKRMADKFGNDPARLAVGYFSGEGNVSMGGDTPYKEDRKDGNGKSVSSYARDLVARVGNAVVPSAKAAEPAPDLSKAPKYREFIAKPAWAGLDDAQKDQARNAYFDRYVAPHLPASQRDGQRDAFLRRAAEIEGPAPAAAEQPGLLDRAASAINAGLKAVLPAGGETGGDPMGTGAADIAAVGTAPAPNKIGVMGAAPAPVAPNASRAPVTPEFRAQVMRAYDAATPAERDQMAKADGVVGQLVRERAGIKGASTETGALLDTTAEGRAARLRKQGVDGQVAEKWGRGGAARGDVPGTELGNMGVSNFDFDAQERFNKDPVFSNPVIRAAVKGYEGYRAGSLGLAQALFDATGNEEFADIARGGIEASQRRTAAIGEKGDGLQRNFEGAVSSIAQQLPALLAGVATGTQAVPLAAMFTQTFGQEYGQGRSQGLDGAQAATRAGIFGAFEVIGERFGLGNTLQALKMAGRGAATQDIATVLAKGILKEIPGEQLTTLGQFLTDKVPRIGTNLEAGLTEYLKQAGDTLAQTVMQGGLMMGGTTGVSAGARHLQGGQSQQTQALAADQARENALNKAAAFGQPVRPKHASQVAAEQVVREMAADAGMDVADLLPPESSAPAQPPVAAAPPQAPAPAAEPLAPVAAASAAPQPTEPGAQPAYDPRQVLDFAQTRYERLLSKRDGEAAMMSGEDGVPVDAEIAGQELTPEEQQEMSVLEQSRDDVAALARFYGFDEDATDGTAQQPDDVGGRGAAPDATLAGDPAAGRADTASAGEIGEGAARAEAPAADGGAVPGADGSADGQPALTAGEPPAQAAPAAPADMTDDQLRERANYIREQARANGGWNKMASAERDRVDAEIARRAAVQQAVTEAKPDTAQALEAAAQEAATSPQNDRPEPTDAQKEAGNYKLGHVSLHGLDISIENPRGSTRSGTGADGKAWSVEMANHYGYFKRTEGADGDHVDVFVGPHPDSTKVFVVDQVYPDTGRFDEHKVLMGFNSLTAARAGYLANYEKGWKGAGAITAMSLGEFKAWLKEGDTTKPFDQKVGKPRTEAQARAARGQASSAAKAKPPRRSPAPAAAGEATAEQDRLADEPTLFSRVPASADRVTAAEIRTMIDPINAKWTNGPKGGVEVVQSVGDLPPHLADYLRSTGEDGRAEGFYLPKSDKVYLIADNLPSVERAQAVAFHEVYGHKGMRSILPGEQYAAMMDRIRRANPAIARAADAWFEQYGVDTIMANRDAGQSNAEAKRNAELLAVEEALANLAGTVPVAGPVRKLLVALQDALRRIGLHAVADWIEGASQAETFKMLADARAAVFGTTVKGSTHVALPAAAPAFARPDGQAEGPGISFARSRDAGQMNLFRLLAREGKEDTVDTISGWDKTVGTQYNKALKDEHFGKVFGYALAMQNEVSMASVRPAELAPGLLPKVDAFGTALRQFVLGRRRDKEMVGATQAIFAGTTAGETVAQGKVWAPEELKERFGLSARGISLYQQARRAIDASLDEVAAAEAYAMAQGYVPKDLRRIVMHDPAGARAALLSALDQQTSMLERVTKRGARAKTDAERAEALETALKPYAETRQKVEDIFDRAADLKKAGYAPLMRFGKYTVYANEVGPNGEVLRDEDDQPKTLYFGIFETEAEAIRAADKLRARYADRGDVRVTRGKKDQKGHELFTGISPETVALFGDVIGKDEATQKFYQQALSERSALKRRLGRRAIEGYSTDLPRVLSNFITSNGRFAAQRYYLRDLNNAIRAVPKSKGDVKDEAITLRNYLMDANDGGAGASTLMFAYFLGGSVASAVVNLSQPFMMTGPYLSQWGAGRTAAAMAKALPFALGKKQIADPALRAAIIRANQEGIVEAQEIFHLYSQGAQGVSAALARRLASIPKVGAKLGESTETMRARMEGFMTLWGMMFAAAESFNRKLTFVSAWELAKATDQADPYEFAARAVNETQGIFNKVNRPNWARSTPGRLLMTFKQYSIMYLELTRRMWRAGPQGKKAVLMMMAVLFLASGEEGLPFAQDIADLVDTIGQALGYDTNLLRDKRKWAHQILGQNAGDFALYGISSMMPLDFAGRVGLGNLIPGTGLLKPAESKDRTREITDVIGPAGALVSAGMDSYDAWTAKQPGRAVMAVMPKAVGNAAAGLEMAMTDKAVDYKGRKVTDVGLADAVVKGLGFTPTKVAQDTRRRMPARQDIALVQKTQADILDLWSRGLAEGDKGMQDRAAAWLKDWNEKNPESPILISNKSLVSRVKQMATPSADRMLKGAPKGLRGRLSESLSTADH